MTARYMYWPNTWALYTRQRTSDGWTYRNTYPSNQLRTMRDFPATSKRVKPLDLFINATSRTVNSEGMSYASCTWLYPDKLSMYQDYPVWTLFPPSATRIRDPSWSSPAFQEPALTISRESMYNSIRTQIRGNEVNLGVMLGEYAETAETFLQIAKTVSSRGRNLLKRHPSVVRAKRMVDIPSTAASAHLQWTYGMKPLAQDLGQAAAEVKVGLQVRPPYLEGVVRRKERQETSAYRAASSTVFLAVASSTLIREVLMRSQYRAYCNTNPLLTALASSGILNPLSIAWELTPYSFVIDWFLNVGDGIASLDNLLLFTDLKVMNSTSTRVYEYCKPMSHALFVDNTQTAFRYTRSDSRSVPTSISMIVTPEYKPGHSIGHVLNGLALLQMARGKF